MIIRNLTPHDINVDRHTIKKDIFIARVEENSNSCYEDMSRETLENIDFHGDWEYYKTKINGIPVVTTTYGKIQNLPAPEINTIFIVSRMVFDALKKDCSKRDDIFRVALLIRNDNGYVVGAQALECLNTKDDNNE